MDKKPIIYIFLLILLISNLTGCIDNTTLINHAVIKGKDSYKSIQDAIDAASEGDTIYVYGGTFQENIIINKSIKLIDKGKEKTIIDYKNNTSGNIITINKNNCIIKGFTITNSYNKYGSTGFIKAIEIKSSNNNITNNIILNTTYGILISPGSQNNIIFNNHIFNNQNGIQIWKSSYNTISLNNISLNTQFGVIIVEDAENNEILFNNFSNNPEAVHLKNVRYNTISNNILYNNTEGVVECCGAKDNTIIGNTNQG
jgi:parallel beta-helix repeat protein